MVMVRDRVVVSVSVLQSMQMANESAISAKSVAKVLIIYLPDSYRGLEMMCKCCSKAWEEETA